jgi:hypothetical protein
MSEPSEPNICRVPGCGRPVHATGLCRTHYDKGEKYRIRGYTPRGSEREFYAGIKVEPATLQALEGAEKLTSLSPSVVLGQVADGWARKEVWNPRKHVRAGAAVVASLALAGMMGFHCAPHAVRPSGPAAEVVSKAMPPGPLEGQARPPCEEPTVEKVGGCWGAVRYPDGRQKRGCLESKLMYEDKDGLCWLPAWEKPPPRIPTSIEMHPQ